MFEINKEKIEEMEAANKAKSMFFNMMESMILGSEEAPESLKAFVRVVKKAREVNNAVTDCIVMKYCDPEHQANNETLKKVVEYLELVEVGIRQFVDTTPFVADETEEEE